MNKLDEMGKPVLLAIGVSLGIVSFLLLLSSKTAHPDVRLGHNELLLTFLSLLIFFGWNIGFSWHFRDTNRGKLSDAKLDLKAIAISFFVLYFPIVIALLMSRFWLTLPRSYYLYSALSLAGGLLFGSLIDFGGRKIMGRVKK